ncbi:MAG: RraA family protein [Fimbriimonadaceae bacterium]|nr:RraA family protein [Alphaproteobacteria bacterium]
MSTQSSKAQEEKKPFVVVEGDGHEKPKSSELIPGLGFQIRTKFPRLPDLIVDQFRKFASTDISDLLNRLYTMNHGISNLTNDQPLVGIAITVKVFPGDNLMLHKALDLAQPGDVIVVDTSGSDRNAVFGDLIANKALHRGIAGFVIDGLIRDLDGVKETKLPVYARGVTSFGPLHRGPGELNYSISCGGIVVNPGDIIVADSSGVVVVPSQFAQTTALRLKAHQSRMEKYVQNVKMGIFSNDWVDRQLSADGCVIE